MAWWKYLADAGLWAAAPFTGGATIGPAIGLAGSIAQDAMAPDSGKDSGTDVNGLIGQLTGRSQKSAARSDQLFSAGQDSYNAVQKYLGPLLGGDRNAMLQAVSPQVGQITDQYDSAFKSISELGPRGGGRTSALTNLRSNEARDVSSTINSARTGAFTAEQQLMSAVFQAGASEDSAALDALGRAIGGRAAADSASSASSAEWGKAVGSLVSAWLNRGSGSGGRSNNSSSLLGG